MLVGLALMLMAPAAEAAGAREVDALMAAPCPVPYEAVSRRVWSARDQANAMRGRYVVLSASKPVKIRPPADWSFDPIDSRRFRSEYFALNYLDTLFYIYSVSDLYDRAAKVRALERARALALDFIRQNPFGGRGVDERAWGNKTAGDRVGYLGYLTRALACEGMLRGSQARVLLDSLAFHGKFLSRPTVYSPSNHGLFIDLGLGLLARYAPFLTNAKRWDLLSQNRFRETLLRRVFPSEGIWLEHSPSYQFLILSTLDVFVRATRPEDPLLESLLARMRAAGSAFVMPDGRIPQFGDSYLDFAPASASPEPGLDALMEPLRTDGLTVFPRSGYAMVRNAASSSYLAIASSFHNRSHKHADDLSFELFEDGQRIVNDTGLYEKDTGRYTDFQRSSQAHSTLTVDGRSFGQKDPPYGSGLIATGGGVSSWFGVLAKNPRTERQGVVHERLFLYRPTDALIVVDRITTRKRHDYDRRFQLGPNLTVTPREGALGLAAPGFSGEISDDTSLSGSRSRRVRGNRRTLEGFNFPFFRTREPRWTIDFQSSGRSSVHATTISLDGSDVVRAKVPEGGDGRSVILYRDGRPPMKVSTQVSGGSLSVSETGAP